MTLDPAANQPPANPPAETDRPVWERLGYANDLELERAVYNSRTEGSRLAQRVSELEQSDYRQMPSERAAMRRPSDELAAIGIPTDALDSYISERLNASLAPVLKTNAALSRVRSENPDFARYEPQWNAWLSRHPEINSRLQHALSTSSDNADFVIDGAFAMFTRDTRNGQSAPPQPTLSGDATLPVTQGSGASRGTVAPGEQMPSREEFEMLRVRARQGDQRAQLALMKMAHGSQIHPELPPSR